MVILGANWSPQGGKAMSFGLGRRLLRYVYFRMICQRLMVITKVLCVCVFFFFFMCVS